MKLEDLLEDQISANLIEMANLDSEDTGIDRVIIWVGMDPQRHALRVKVSNTPDKWSNDNFTITIPELKTIGNINKSLISNDVLENIKDWIRFNMKVIVAYEKGEITSTREFLNLIRKI